jgi:hypothetical protein
MTPDLEISFLTYYLQSLGERTRVEKKGTNWGFDWVVYNLALAEGGKPVRLPFLRSGKHGYAKTKTEPEFGVDLSFISSDGKHLSVFVLKDEALTKTNWLSSDFDKDLRMAAYPDLAAQGLEKVRRVTVTLAYNKDDNATGITLFDRLAGSLSGKVGKHATLKFERWNLSELVARTKGKLLSASLLPQRFFGQFAYLSAQVGDFRHGSTEWEQQVIPNWRRLLADVLADGKPERAIRLISMTLVILRASGAQNPSFVTGWIALVEEAVLATWHKHARAKAPKTRRALLQMWIELYLGSLDRFYGEHMEDLATTHGIDSAFGGGSFVDAVGSSMLAYWHLGRLGILSLGYAEQLGVMPQTTGEHRDCARVFADWTARIISANASALRPIVDLHHIEVFLVWRILRDAGRNGDVHYWISELLRRLLLRRFGRVSVPFPEGRNDVDLVFEAVATRQKPPEYCDTSSCLLQMLFEFCCGLPEAERDDLLAGMYRRLVIGQETDDTEGQEKPLDLTSWAPATTWEGQILAGDTTGGECFTIMPFQDAASLTSSALAEKFAEIVKGIRERRPFTFSSYLPNGLVALGCMVHQTPLPPEFWRSSLFPSLSSDAAS